MVSVDVCIFSQIPSSGGPVQLIGSVSKATAGAVGSAMTVPQRQNISANTQIVVPANNQNSGSLLAQQQHVSYFLWVFTSFSYEPIPWMEFTIFYVFIVMLDEIEKPNSKGGPSQN